MSDEEMGLVHVESGFPITPPPAAEIAFQEYKDLGPSRSIVALHNHYLARLAKDPYAPVPTNNLTLLGRWETVYDWKVRAMEYDVEANRAYVAIRKNALRDYYAVQQNLGDKLRVIAENRLELMPETELSPKDVLDYLKASSQINKEATIELLKLDDPNDEDTSGGDLFDNLRKVMLLQVNNVQNNYGTTDG